MKIVGFAQLRNELEQGNLHGWITSMLTICDCVYIYDQNSTDYSKDVYLQHPNLHVIYSPVNDFSNEIKCKATLLRKAKAEQPDADWFFWMDGDTLLDGRIIKESLHTQLTQSTQNTADAVSFGHFNLWRSDIWARLDNAYNGIHERGVVCLWKNKEELEFSEEGGLHYPQYPLQINRVVRFPYVLIHRGFATDESIIRKYNIYKERGLSGWDLDRLLDEETLKVGKIPYSSIPDYFLINDTVNPVNKKKLKDIYES